MPITGGAAGRFNGSRADASSGATATEIAEELERNKGKALRVSQHLQASSSSSLTAAVTTSSRRAGVPDRRSAPCTRGVPVGAAASGSSAARRTSLPGDAHSHGASSTGSGKRLAEPKARCTVAPSSGSDPGAGPSSLRAPKVNSCRGSWVVRGRPYESSEAERQPFIRYAGSREGVGEGADLDAHKGRPLLRRR